MKPDAIFGMSEHFGWWGVAVDPFLATTTGIERTAVVPVLDPRTSGIFSLISNFVQNSLFNAPR